MKHIITGAFIGIVGCSLFAGCSTSQRKDYSNVTFTAAKDETAMAPPQKHPQTLYYKVTKEEAANSPTTDFPLVLTKIEKGTNERGEATEFPTVLHLHKILKEEPAKVAAVKKVEPQIQRPEPAPVDLGASSSGRSH